MQTGASALLAAATIATLYSLVRFFDLFRRIPTAEVEPQRIEFEPPIPEALSPGRQEVRASPATIEPRLVVDNAGEAAQPLEQALPVEEMAPPAKSGRRGKPARKGTARAKAAKSADVELSPAAKPDIAEPGPQEEIFHSPVAPLFEPEPFVRQQQRAMFGRKSG